MPSKQSGRGSWDRGVWNQENLTDYACSSSHHCRQMLTLLPTDAYIAAGRCLHCCQQPLTLLLASLIDGDELSIKPLLAPLCPRCIGSCCKHNSVSIHGWVRPLSHPGPR